MDNKENQLFILTRNSLVFDGFKVNMSQVMSQTFCRSYKFKSYLKRIFWSSVPNEQLTDITTSDKSPNVMIAEVLSGDVKVKQDLVGTIHGQEVAVVEVRIVYWMPDPLSAIFNVEDHE